MFAKVERREWVIIVIAVAIIATLLLREPPCPELIKKELVDHFGNKFELNDSVPPALFGYPVLINGNANGMGTQLYINSDSVAIVINAQGSKHYFDGKTWVAF